MMHCEQLYYHGEPISVNVHVTNNSTKTVKRVKISGASPLYELSHVFLVQTETCLVVLKLLIVCVSLQCVSMQTSASSALPSTSVQWPSWKQSKSQFTFPVYVPCSQ